MQNNYVVEKETVKKCCVCRSDISAKKETAKTCCARCRSKLFDKTHKKRKGKCLFCGAKLEVKNLRKTYCNSKCATTHYRIVHNPKKSTLLQKFDLLKKIGLIASQEPPKGSRIIYNVGSEKIQIFCTDLGGAIAKTPKDIAAILELNEIIFFCKKLNINPYKFCSKIEMITAILQSDSFSIVETCINEIWKSYQAPPLQPEKPSTSEKENTLLALSYEDGIIAYKFWECNEKKKLVDTIQKYRLFSIS